MMSAAAESAERRRVRLRVSGIVQGVGFRPHVFKLATELDLGGYVLNDERGVLLEVEGSVDALELFGERLRAEAPPLAVIDAVEFEPSAAIGERDFRILASRSAGEAEALVSPDTATCAECLVEVLDPADRRYRYPFTNCTNCGPRLTIVRGVPYDRSLTTMAGFEMCAECQAEYEDPANRRFHAQPNACPVCGPSARLLDAAGHEIAPTGAERQETWHAATKSAARRSAGGDAVGAAARMVVEGRIVAVKGVGGYHLACRADDGAAVARLRARKHRDEKPLALLVADLEAARALVGLSPGEQALLQGRERPIVIARRLAGAGVADAVAPRSADLGVMLPYSPLHHLLAADAGVALVLTSGNISDEPIAFEDDDALARLGEIADAFLVHDRPIETRVDDSVVRSLAPEIAPAPLLMRRSRGYAPQSLGLPIEATRPILACGAELKNTFCLAKGSRAWIGHHVGDLRNWETLQSFRHGVRHFERLFAVVPELAAHDLHPDYLSTVYALEREDIGERIAVQHHHAHLAACLAEHGSSEPAVGAIYDGAGLGLDGTVWGGEILTGDLTGFERAGLLFPVRLPGGDAAAREPWRMACSWLGALGGSERPPMPQGLRGKVAEHAWDAVCEIVAGGLNSPLTTSVGRLFDAVAAIAGVRARVSHEGQGATELEGLADLSVRDAYPMGLIDGSEPAIIDARETVAALVADLTGGASVAIASARFHNALAAATTAACAQAASNAGLRRVVLAGGVFQNRLLLERTTLQLRQQGLEVLIPQRLPPNDGAISYGQAAITAARPVTTAERHQTPNYLAKSATRLGSVAVRAISRPVARSAAG